MRKGILPRLIAALIAVSLMVSCSKSQKSVEDCLGELSYDSSVSAMVYEEVEGEDGAKGIQYRRVTDVDSLKKQEEITILFYFYNPTRSDLAGVTAGVEDLAQTLDGQLLVVAVDTMQERELVTYYCVEGIPGFVLSRGGKIVSSFDGQERVSWTMSDVVDWVENYGFVPDMSLLE
ncbi:MAG: hypothetical protein IJ869_08360 [Clostridiales bacterium]|nr:hypothetical protein [Clostridiales bacterium]